LHKSKNSNRTAAAEKSKDGKAQVVRRSPMNNFCINILISTQHTENDFKIITIVAGIVWPIDLPLRGLLTTFPILLISL
jgi:hypothetical protein